MNGNQKALNNFKAVRSARLYHQSLIEPRKTTREETAAESKS